MKSQDQQHLNRRAALIVGAGAVGGILTTVSLGGGSVEASPQGPATGSTGFILENVTIVNTRDGSLAPGMAILIDAGKISKIGPAGSLAAAGAAKSIDGSGKFVVPGYLDMHAHPLNATDPAGSLMLTLANGITGVRQMSGTPTQLADRRAGKPLPTVDAPEILVMPGDLLAGPNISTAAVAVAEIRKQKAEGADFIKAVDGSPDPYLAAIAEATRQNLPFCGHLPPAVDVRTASDAGMHSIEHMGPRDSLLLGCSSDEAALRKSIAENPLQSPPITGPLPANAIARTIANPTLQVAPSEVARYQRVIDTYSDSKAQSLAARFAKNRTWQVPTLIRIRTMEIADDPIYSNDPNLRYVPKPNVQLWQELTQEFTTTIPAASRETLKQLFAFQMKLLRPLKQAGVKMLAGSDFGGGWVIAGFGLHQEFDLLAQAGLSPLEILQMTTIDGAEFLGRESTMGTVEAGKDANLVLLDANPIESVQSLHKISAVVRGGKMYSAGTLDALKKAVADRVTTGAGSKVAQVPCC